MDEPLSNLDAKLRVSTRAQLKNLQHELKVTTIYVTHDQIEAMTLADRVVVMSNAEIQQVGTPTDIYNNPANTFVAGFIGSPAMNLVDGSIANGVFSTRDIEISGLSASVNGEITLGFRAEDAQVFSGDQVSQAQIKAPVFSMELLGDATMVTVRAGGSLASAKADKEFRIEIGKQVGIAIDPGLCHLFDKQTGNRI
jgi:multiple sugar transport system ATP-binding protein